MKTKLEMAHEWAIELLRSGYHSDDIISCAWQYADAMQAEADKRKSGEFPDVLRGACGEIVAVKVDDIEWQPDWSQAPEWATWWAMDGDKKTRWIYSELEQPYIGDMFLKWFAIGRFNSEDAPSFDYQGDWRDSLRKRPKRCASNHCENI